MNDLSLEQFEQWLKQYGAAWEAKDEKAFVDLFHEDALYYWTPFEDPKKGHSGIGKAFSDAVSTQSDVDFGARALYVDARLGGAHWSCSFTRKNSDQRVHLDGIFAVQFSDQGNALSFREWWHSDE